MEKIENKLKEKVVFGTEKVEDFYSLTQQSNMLAVALIKNIISNRYATRIVNYENEKASNIFVDFHEFGTNPGSLKGACEKKCLEKFEIIKDVFSASNDFSRQVTSLQEELEHEREEESQLLSKMLMEYDEESTSTTLPSSQGPSNDEGIEEIEKIKKKIIIGTEINKQFYRLSRPSNELAVGLIMNTVSKRHTTRIINYERKNGNVSNIFVESRKFGMNIGSLKGASKKKCLKEFNIIKGVFSNIEDLSRQILSLQDELEVLKSKNWRLSQQLMKYIYDNIRVKKDNIDSLEKELSGLQKKYVRNIVIIGDVRTGKSTLAKVLSNNKAFIEDHKFGRERISGSIEIATFKEKYILYKIIDTVGFNDLCLKLRLKNNLDEFVSAIKRGLNQVFFVINYKASGTKLIDKEKLIELNSLLNNKGRKYITIIVTNSEEINEEQQEMVQAEIIRETTPQKVCLIDRNRFIFIKNPPLGKGCEEKCNECCRNMESCSKNRVERENSRKKLLEYLEDKCKENYNPGNLSELIKNIREFDIEDIETRIAEPKQDTMIKPEFPNTVKTMVEIATQVSLYCLCNI
ncbi:unnamed protein product [Rhizophagus irregularis]|nr:unnamed protein product [Rhizophagus irregularis]